MHLSPRCGARARRRTPVPGIAGGAGGQGQASLAHAWWCRRGRGVPTFVPVGGRSVYRVRSPKHRVRRPGSFNSESAVPGIRETPLEGPGFLRQLTKETARDQSSPPASSPKGADQISQQDGETG